MKKIIELDKWLFVQINQGSANSFFDDWMPFLRQPLVWIPLYVFLVFFVLLNFPKKAAAWLLTLAVTVTATDIISSRFIKPFFARPRPCIDADLADHIRVLVTYCGQNGSFTSSHATNHFGVAMFLFITLKPVIGNAGYLFFLWAATICYAQIYVGVHFPFDIVGGMLVGMLLGSFAAQILLRIAGPLTPPLK